MFPLLLALLLHPAPAQDASGEALRVMSRTSYANLARIQKLVHSPVREVELCLV